MRGSSTAPSRARKASTPSSGKRASDPGTKRTKKPTPTRGPIGVLVVDDVEDNRDLYATYLAHAGYRVEQAADGEQALERLAEHKSRVVIMDLAMPVLDGFEATRIIKSSPETRDTIVIVVTGHATREDLKRARDAGADDVVTKPCLPADLLARVKKALGED